MVALGQNSVQKDLWPSFLMALGTAFAFDLFMLGRLMDEIGARRNRPLTHLGRVGIEVAFWNLERVS